MPHPTEPLREHGQSELSPPEEAGHDRLDTVPEPEIAATPGNVLLQGIAAEQAMDTAVPSATVLRERSAQPGTEKLLDTDQLSDIVPTGIGRQGRFHQGTERLGTRFPELVLSGIGRLGAATPRGTSCQDIAATLDMPQGAVGTRGGYSPAGRWCHQVLGRPDTQSLARLAMRTDPGGSLPAERKGPDIGPGTLRMDAAPRGIARLILAHLELGPAGRSPESTAMLESWDRRDMERRLVGCSLALVDKLRVLAEPVELAGRLVRWEAVSPLAARWAAGREVFPAVRIRCVDQAPPCRLSKLPACSRCKARSSDLRPTSLRDDNRRPKKSAAFCPSCSYQSLYPLHSRRARKVQVPVLVVSIAPVGLRSDPRDRNNVAPHLNFSQPLDANRPIGHNPVLT